MKGFPFLIAIELPVRLPAMFETAIAMAIA